MWQRNLFSFFIAVLCLFFFEKIVAQDINSQFLFHHYQEEDGLLNQNINCLLQDSRGFIWVGTTDGLFRFDGYKFTAYRYNSRDTNSISGNQINSIAEDSKGRIWIGTNTAGINLLNGYSNKFIHYQLSGNANEHSGRINSIVCSPDGKVFASCDLFVGFYQFDEKKNSFTHFLLSDFHSEQTNKNYGSGYTYSLLLKGNDSLFIGTRYGLYCLNLKNKSISEFILPNYDFKDEANMLCRIIKNNPFNQHLIIGTWGNGLKELNTSTREAKSFWYHPVKPEGMGLFNIIQDVGFLSTDKIFIASMDENLCILNTEKNTFSFFTHDDSNAGSIPNGKCHCILQDRDGIFWFGFENGLCTYNPRTSRFHNQFFTNTFPYINAGNITESVSGDTIFVPTALGDGIHLYDKEGNFLANMQTELNANGDQFIYGSTLDDEGNSWFISGIAWFKFLAHEKKFGETAHDLRLRELTNRRMVVKGAAHQMILQFGNKQVEVRNTITNEIIFRKKLIYPFADSNQVNINDIERAPDGHYWVAYLYAVIEYDENFNLLKAYPEKINDTTYIGQGHIFDLAVGSNGKVFIVSSDGGLCSIDPKKNNFKNYADGNPLAPGRCNGITIDANEVVWLATENGIYRFNSSTEIFTLFDKQDGLPNNNIAYILTQPSGRIYYWFERGWDWFYPNEFSVLKNLSPIVFLSVKVNEKEISTADFEKEILLDYTKNNLSFDFSLLNYANPKKNSYAYQLEGGEVVWHNSGTQHQLNYSSLAPGNYTLKIKAANSEGVWSEYSCAIKFSIAPPYWQTLWFRVLIILLIALCVYLIFKLRVRIVKREEKLKSNYQKKISELETKALRAQMNPHFIFNCLNSINSFILRNDTDVASEYLTKFSRLIRLVLDNSRTSIISLSSELECLKLFIEMEEMRFADKFEYSIHVDEKINAETIKVPPLILQPYVENSIWHGLLHKNEKGKLKIEISEQKGYIICVIEDNGIGREAAREAKSKSSGHRKSHGMGITSQRVIEWNLDNEAAVNISDLYDEEKKAAGTRVEIKLKIV